MNYINKINSIKTLNDEKKIAVKKAVLKLAYIVKDIHGSKNKAIKLTVNPLTHVVSRKTMLYVQKKGKKALADLKGNQSSLAPGLSDILKIVINKSNQLQSQMDKMHTNVLVTYQTDNTIDAKTEFRLVTRHDVDCICNNLDKKLASVAK